MSYLNQRNVPFFNSNLSNSPEEFYVPSHNFEDINPSLRHYLTDEKVLLDDLDLDSPVRRRRSLSPVRHRLPSPVINLAVSPVRNRSASSVRNRSRSPVRNRSASPVRNRSRFTGLATEDMSEELFNNFIKPRVDKANIYQIKRQRNSKLSTAKRKLEILKRELNDEIKEKADYIEKCRISQIPQSARTISKYDRSIGKLINLIEIKNRTIQELETSEIILPELTREQYINTYNRLRNNRSRQRN